MHRANQTSTDHKQDVLTIIGEGMRALHFSIVRYVLAMALPFSGAYSCLVIRGSVVRVHPVHVPLDTAFYPQLSLSTQVL